MKRAVKNVDFWPTIMPFLINKGTCGLCGSQELMIDQKENIVTQP